MTDTAWVGRSFRAPAFTARPSVFVFFFRISVSTPLAEGGVQQMAHALVGACRELGVVEKAVEADDVANFRVAQRILEIVPRPDGPPVYPAFPVYL